MAYGSGDQIQELMEEVKQLEKELKKAKKKNKRLKKRLSLVSDFNKEVFDALFQLYQNGDIPFDLIVDDAKPSMCSEVLKAALSATGAGDLLANLTKFAKEFRKGKKVDEEVEMEDEKASEGEELWEPRPGGGMKLKDEVLQKGGPVESGDC